jgi:hypothetical protein
MTEGVNSQWWDFRGWPAPKPYGSTETYEKGMTWLDEACVDIADWGCGLTWAKQYAKRASYHAVDGSVNNPFADEVADLRTYAKPSDGIFMRHVLEHNMEWRDILANAVAAFRKRFVLIMFTPFAETTRPNNPGHLTLDISFRKEDLLAYLTPFAVSEEHLLTDTQYGSEHIFYAERVPAMQVTRAKRRTLGPSSL